MNQKATQAFGELIGEFDAGVFEQKVTAALREAAEGAITHRKTGKVSLSFSMKPIGDSNQVAVTHKLSYLKPTAKGSVTEDDATNTPMHVNRSGYLSIFPDTQQNLPLGQKQEA
jgi:hypothetical protein